MPLELQLVARSSPAEQAGHEGLFGCQLSVLFHRSSLALHTLWMPVACAEQHDARSCLHIITSSALCRRYDLAKFSPVNAVAFDHPDPSIFTVLTCPSAQPGAPS